MGTTYCGDVLQKYLQDIGKFEGAQVSTLQTDENDPASFVITKWVVEGVAQPTESDIEGLITKYRPVIEEEREAEKLIAARLRDNAVAELQSEGKIPLTYKQTTRKDPANDRFYKQKR